MKQTGIFVSMACRLQAESRHCDHRAAVLAVAPTWVNSPVLMEALMRYEQGRLPQQMRHWIQGLLELPDDSRDMAAELLVQRPNNSHSNSTTAMVITHQGNP